MRNFIHSVVQNVNFDVLDVAALCVCAGAAILALALFTALRLTRAPSYKLLARCKKFAKKHGKVTAANAGLFGKKVIKPCGRLIYYTYLYNLRFSGVQAAGRAAAPLVCAKSGAPHGFAAAGIVFSAISFALFALSGYALPAAAAAALAVAAVWIVCALAYALICALARVSEKIAGERTANAILAATTPAPVNADKAIEENPAFVAKSDLDKFFSQADALLSAGVSKQVAAAMLGGIDGMINSNLYCGAERLRLSALKERVKKICV